MRLNISYWTKKMVPLIESSTNRGFQLSDLKKEGFDKPDPRDRKNGFHFMKVPLIQGSTYRVHTVAIRSLTIKNEIFKVAPKL